MNRPFFLSCGGEIMAKDGTNRGGRRVRAGDKPAPAAEKKQKGLPVKIISNDIPALDTAELEAVDLPEGAALNGTDMPKPSDYLSARQKNGVPLGADDIYRETWLWLKQRSCENLVNKRLIEAYSQAYARYIQCEEAISTYGLLGKHQTPKMSTTLTDLWKAIQNALRLNVRQSTIFDKFKKDRTFISVRFFCCYGH